MNADPISNTKRLEFLSDLTSVCKPIIFSVLMNLWKRIYENPEIPHRFWLERFQRSLKSTLQYDENKLYEKLKKSERKHMLYSLIEVYRLTGIIYHSDKPLLREDNILLMSFLKDTLINTAREVWREPYIFYHLSHKKDLVDQAKQSFDKLFGTVVKYTIRFQTSEMLCVQNRNKQLSLQVTPNDDSFETESTTTESDLIALDEDDTTSSSAQFEVEDDQAETTKPVQPINDSKGFEHQERIEKYDVDPTDSTLKPTSISRASSIKALVNDDDDSEDLFIPRSSTINVESQAVTTVDTDQRKKLVQIDGTSSESNDSSSESVVSEPHSSSIHKKSIQIVPYTSRSTYYKPKPLVMQKLYKRKQKRTRSL